MRTWFETDPDKYADAEEKNDRLSDLLLGIWNKLSIRSIRRIEGDAPGWSAVYATGDSDAKAPRKNKRIIKKKMLKRG